MLKARVKARKKSGASGFDKYDFYKKAVQSPETDVEFLRDVYKELRGQKAVSMREDFCGTFALSCEWVKLDSKHKAVGVDLDTEPLDYGHRENLPQLSAGQKERLSILNANVLHPNLPPVDLVAAMNFSYFIFKTRPLMLRYFRNVRRTLKKNGIFVLDLFGGSLCFDANEEKTKHRQFTYYWHQKNFDPATNFAEFAIHFKPHGQKKIEDVFTYDWRMWSIPELRDILTEAGFKKVHLYWEGTNRAGGGDGKFKRVEEGESCLSWIAYLAAEA